MSEPVASKEDLIRVEKKIDAVVEAVNRLVVIEDRQSRHHQELQTMQKRVDDLNKEILLLDRKLAAWVNRGVGAWFLLVTAWSLLTFVVKLS